MIPIFFFSRKTYYFLRAMGQAWLQFAQPQEQLPFLLRTRLKAKNNAAAIMPRMTKSIVFI